ncbi:glycosyltransferase family 4 protein [Serinibacter salmoneus]|uniref:Glycosyl transferase family 1 n=1 Tax=Serinibacter salmoneus TaxID=556530 RepID=A0A2A9D3N8_9MICO|nr:glycosyltransferase family 4 protein [Serinibacter salmoneus]PFG20460.1 glycosyl transferase family 1 [Serinibacter salmoneus]
MKPIQVCFPIERDLEEWTARFDAGEAPSRWPYGLEGLASGAPGFLRPLSRTAALAGWARSALPRSSRGAAALVWDENTAMRLTPAGGRRRYAGVIWLTDRDPHTVASRKQRAWLSRFDGLWVLSDAQVEPLRRLLGPRAPRISYVRFGIDTDFFRPAPYPSVPRILSVGGDRDRDAATLFAALERVLARHPGLEVTVQTTSALSPPRGVRVVPRLTHAELRREYEAAGLVMLATRPNLHVSGMTVSLEAMATARPVVVTSSPGMADYVRAGTDGILVPQGDAAALAAGAERLLAAPEQAAAWGRQARERVESEFTTHALCARLARVVGADPEVGTHQ